MLSRVRKSSLRSDNNDEHKKNLVSDLKKNVKSLMELLAYRKLVNEDSGVVYLLCLSLEACIKHGLKRRPFETFSSSDTYYIDLLSRLDQLGCASAAFVSSRIRTLKTRSPSVTTSPVYKMFSFGSTSRSDSSSDGPHFRESQKSRSSLTDQSLLSDKVLWIRIALVDKHLMQILNCLVSNAAALYQQHALFADPVSGPLIPALLAGPCSVDYSHLRGTDIPSYGDNTIDELLSRRKLTSTPSVKPPSRQNLLTRARHFSIVAGDLLHSNRNSDNSASSGNSEHEHMLSAIGLNIPGNRMPELIFAKNNVAMEPFTGSSPILGYLAVFNIIPVDENTGGALVRWTPNNYFQSLSFESSPLLSKRIPHIQNVRLSDVSHIHCHTRPHSDSLATVVFIGRDGVQFPALMFKQAASAFSLLQALTIAVPANTRLEPPLTASAFEVDNESRDLVFQLVPSSPKSGETLSSNSPLPKVPEDNLDTEEIAASDEAENKVPSLDGNSNLAFSRSIRESKTDYDLRMASSDRLPSSKSMSSGLSSTLEAALSAVTMAGAQFFNEIDNEYENSHRPNRLQQPRGRLSFVCRSVQRQLVARAFYGWFAYVRHVKTVRTQLAALVRTENHDKLGAASFEPEELLGCSGVLDMESFSRLQTMWLSNPGRAARCLRRIVYSAGIAEPTMRPHLWSVLLGLVPLGASEEEVAHAWRNNAEGYSTLCAEWRAAEVQAEALAACRRISPDDVTPTLSTAVTTTTTTTTADVPSADDKESVFPEPAGAKNEQKVKVVFTFSNVPILMPNDKNSPFKVARNGLRRSHSASVDFSKFEAQAGSVVFRKPGLEDVKDGGGIENKRRLSDSGVVALMSAGRPVCFQRKNGHVKTDVSVETPGARSDSSSVAMYSSWLTNLHRIDKDVARCDRSLDFFRPGNQENLSALRRVVCSYVWQHLDPGYIQGMCDLAAPFLVICKTSGVEDPESLAFNLFTKLMDRLGVNFPTGATPNLAGPAAIDIALSRLRSLIQILDPELYEHLSDAPTEMDATHLYFAYRWLLLDFKREFVYADVFRIWETIWSADEVASAAFSLFVAFALIETYRDVIIAENMDFTDIIKFFNDMAERHNVDQVLDLARQLVHRVQETSPSSGLRSPTGCIS